MKTEPEIREMLPQAKDTWSPQNLQETRKGSFQSFQMKIGPTEALIADF